MTPVKALILEADLPLSAETFPKTAAVDCGAIGGRIEYFRPGSHRSRSQQSQKTFSFFEGISLKYIVRGYNCLNRYKLLKFIGKLPK
tara:strand:+ start:97 stop:357 length:261 start_codon:yes stop_codon:yes gene_type:complete